MAQRGARLSQEKFSCSICLELLKNPVTLPCGHSYCLSCIRTCWDGPGHTGTYSCPQCRKEFIPRPALVKNVMLAELVEDLKKAEAADPSPDGAGDVSCDVCREKKLKAVKSCLVCLASYCQEHLQHHYEAPALMKHKLVDPSKNLQENICPLHDEVMKIFCRTDQLCICYLCLMDQHKGHETVSTAAERAEKQKKLKVSQDQIHQKIQTREKEVKQLEKMVENINLSADKSVALSETIFSELISLIQRRSSEVQQQIRAQQEAETSRVKELREKLQQEVRELQRRDAELEELSRSEDHKFLKNFPSLSELESADWSSFSLPPVFDFKEVTAAVSELSQKLQDLLGGANISLKEPESSAEFLKLAKEISLEPNTANRFVTVSERRATLVRDKQPHCAHPDRFTHKYQVLSKQRLSGRCYWEVEVDGDDVCVAVSYKSIGRAGTSDECAFGQNDKSWALCCAEGGYTLWHNKTITPASGPKTPVSGPGPRRVGVFVDHRAGVLSFYSVSGSRTLLHRVQTCFSEPLHAGVLLSYQGSSAEFVKLQAA